MLAQDIITYAVIIFAFSLTSFIAIYTWQRYAEVASPVLGEAGQAEIEKASIVFSVIDYASMALAGILLVVLYLTGSRVNSSPAFVVLGIIMIGVGILLTSIFSNTFNSVHNGTLMNGTITAVPTINNVMLNLPLILVVGGGLFLFGLYSKSGGTDYA